MADSATSSLGGAHLAMRAAVPADAVAIARVINLAFEVERFFITGDRITVEEVRELLGGGSFLLMESDGALVGCVYVEVRKERGYFGLLSVDPAQQRAGIGRRLVAAAEDHCRSAGCTVMDLQTVNLRTELPPLYRRLGYVEIGTAPFEAPDRVKRPCHFVLMSKTLVA